MRSYKTVIQEAELLASPPAAVAEFLKKRAAQSKDERRDDDVDKEFESALHSRNDPLINLALARYGQFNATVLPLFKGGEPSGAIRLAVLANKTLGDEFFSGFPVALFGSPEQTAVWLVTAPDAEISALFENPKLDDSFLRDLLEGSKPWDSIPEERLAAFVESLVRNERMRTPYDDSFMDGYSEYSYGSVFNAAWMLAERMPVNERWSRALCWLYDRMQTDAVSINKPLELAARWYPDPGNVELMEKEVKELERGWLPNYQGVRKGLARLALHNDSKLLASLLASEDPAFRSAAYADGNLSPEQLSAAYEKDGELVFNQAMHNHNIWRTAQGRAALKAVAWLVVDNDKHSDLLTANIYNGIQEDLAKKHSDWFKDEEDLASEPCDEPATKADIGALADRLTQSSSDQVIDQLKQSLQSLSSRVGWVWWFSLGALVASITNL